MTDLANNNDAAPAAAEARAADAVNLSALLTEVVKFLVDDPAQVSVEEVKQGQNVTLNLTVAQKDIGKVIGKQGRTVRSLRTLLDAAASKLNTRCTLEIIEEDDEDEPENSAEPDDNLGNRAD